MKSSILIYSSEVWQKDRDNHNTLSHWLFKPQVPTTQISWSITMFFIKTSLCHTEIWTWQANSQRVSIVDAGDHIPTYLQSYLFNRSRRKPKSALELLFPQIKPKNISHGHKTAAITTKALLKQWEETHRAISITCLYCVNLMSV